MDLKREEPPYLLEHPDGLVVRIQVQPRSSRNEVAGVHGDALKVKLTAPPVDGAANKMCIDFLSRQFKVSKSGIRIISGENSRLKKVLFQCRDDREKAILRHSLEKFR